MPGLRISDVVTLDLRERLVERRKAAVVIIPRHLRNRRRLVVYFDGDVVDASANTRDEFECGLRSVVTLIGHDKNRLPAGWTFDVRIDFIELRSDRRDRIKCDFVFARLFVIVHAVEAGANVRECVQRDVDMDSRLIGAQMRIERRHPGKHVAARRNGLARAAESFAEQQKKKGAKSQVFHTMT